MFIISRRRTTRPRIGLIYTPSGRGARARVREHRPRHRRHGERGARVRESIDLELGTDGTAEGELDLAGTGIRDTTSLGRAMRTNTSGAESGTKQS